MKSQVSPLTPDSPLFFRSVSSYGNMHTKTRVHTRKVNVREIRNLSKRFNFHFRNLRGLTLFVSTWIRYEM